MNILVTGADGQLGRSLRRETDGSPDNYIFTDVAELDITDAAAVGRMVESVRPEVLVNCAAYTNVEGAEDNREAARRLNASAPGILSAAMHRCGGTIIHISTDYVFGDRPVNTPIAEDVSPAPLGVYGHTKLDGEREVTAANPRHIIIRTAWLYSEYGHNFLKTMMQLTAVRPQVSVVDDQAGTPTYAGDLARAIVRIISGGDTLQRTGIYHFSNEGVCSWFDFAYAIARRAGNAGCRVMPCRSSQFPSKVKRPPYSVLDKSKIKDTFGIEIPYWTDSMCKCLDNLKEL